MYQCQLIKNSLLALLIVSLYSNASAQEPQLPDLILGDGFELSELTPCLEELLNRGVEFEVRSWTEAISPIGQVCEVSKPVWVGPDFSGLNIRYISEDIGTAVLLSCEGALALADTASDLANHGVNEIIHIGTFNCREVEGTETLSQHAYGKAIDLAGFKLLDGTTYMIDEDWEFGTNPTTPGGIFLWEAVNRWHEAEIWSVILTPNYSSANAGFFHCDLTEGASFLQ